MKLCINVPKSMKLAAAPQPWEEPLTGADVGDLMTAVDKLGFYKCTLGEHFVIPDEHIELSGDWYFHTNVALAYFGGKTTNMRLCPSISILPLQHPIVQAKGWSTLDWLTGGRAEAMFGVGWLKEEFDMLNVPFNKRGAMADEYIAAMIELWTKDNPEFEGEYVNFKDCGFAPKPVQKGGIPVWFGGDAPAVQRRVAKFGNGWSPFRTPPETFPDCIDYIKSQPEYDGRELGMFFALEMLNIGAHHEILDDPRAPGTSDKHKLIDQISWLEGLGITETIVPLPPGLSDKQAWLDRQQWVAEEIMPNV